MKNFDAVVTLRFPVNDVPREDDAKVLTDAILVTLVGDCPIGASGEVTRLQER